MENKRSSFFGRLILSLFVVTLLFAEGFYGKEAYQFHQNDKELKVYELFLQYATAKNLTPPALDAKYSLAAYQYNKYLKDKETNTLNESVLKDIVHANGGYDEYVPLIVIKPKRNSYESILNEQLKALLSRENFNMLGVSVIDSDRENEVIVIILVRRYLQLEKIPFATKARELKISGKLLTDYFKPRFLVLMPDKEIKEYDLKDEQKIFEKVFYFPEQTGEYVFQIIGDDKYGSKSLAIFPIYFRTTKDSQKYEKNIETKDPKNIYTQYEAEQFLTEKINNYRVGRGLKAIKYNVTLSKVAADHSTDMALHDFFSHGSPTKKETANARLSKTGLKFSKYRENIGVGSTLTNIFNEFLKVPESRRNLLDSDLNEFGVGVAAKTEFNGMIYYYITVDFIETNIEYYNTDQKQLLLNLVNERRNLAGLAPLISDPEYSRLAQKHTTVMAAKDSLSYVQEGEHLGEQYKKISSVKDVFIQIFALKDISLLETTKIFDKEYNKLGIGYINSNSSIYGPNTHWIVLVFIKD